MHVMIKILKGFCAFVLILLLACLMYAHFSQEDLSRRVLKAVRSTIATNLQVAQFDMDLISSFPRIRFEMHDVILDGTNQSQLLQASQLQLTTSLFSIFSDDIRFQKLSLINGTIRIERLKDGSLSLNILDSKGEQKNPGPALHFNKIALENVSILYVDQTAQQEYLLHFSNGTINGSYDKQLLTFDVSGDVIYDHVRIDKLVYLNGLKGSISGKIALDLADELYTFDGLRLSIGDLRYDINGTVRGMEKAQNLELTIKQTEGDLETFLSLLPSAYRNELPFSKMQGNFTADGFIKGRMSRSENPHVHFDLSTDDAQFVSTHGKGSIDDVRISGAFDNGDARNMRTAQLDLTHIKGKAYGQKFEASLNLTDFEDFILHSTFNGSLPATFVLDYTDVSKTIEKISGALHFSDVEIGPVRISQMDFTDVAHLEGRCTVANLVLQTPKAIYKIPDGTLELQKDTLQIAGLKLALDDDTVTVNGWLTDLGNSLEANDAGYLQYNVRCEATSLNISKWLPNMTAQSGTSAEPLARPVALKTTGPVRLPKGSWELNAERFQYEGIKASRFTAHGASSTHAIQFEAKANVAEGEITTKGELSVLDRYQLSLQAQGDHLSIQECFTQCQNFGQQIIRAEHLRGKGDLKILADMSWDDKGNLDTDHMYVLAGMSIHDGELLKFDMLEQFSDYVHAEDLKHINFARLDNFIEVRDGNVYIPAMFIQSNAANIVVNGVHRLDNHILYNIKVNAGQVLSTKMKKHNPLLAPLPARKEGTFNLFFTVTGTTDDFTYDFNKRGAESSFGQSAELREKIRERLRQTFGESIDLIEPPEWETIPEYHLEQEGEDTFLDVMDKN